MQKNITEGFRLSPQQKRIWLLQEGKNKSPFQAFCFIKIDRNADINILKEALQIIIQRHEILRTSFLYFSKIGEPVQIINPENKYIWKDANSSDLLLHTDDGEFKIIEETNFDLEHDVLLRISNFGDNKEYIKLLINMPAICSDNSSFIHFVNELIRSYQAIINGIDLIDRPIQFADIAEWQNQILEDKEVNPGREYWKNYCQSFDAQKALFPKLPYGNNFLAGSDFQPRILTYEINNTLYKQLMEFVVVQQSSVSNFLLTCWGVLLQHLVGENKIIIGTVNDGRSYKELKSAIGPLAKTVPLQCDLDICATFSSILNEINAAVRIANDFQEYFTWEDIKGAEEKDGYLPYFPLGFEFVIQPDRFANEDIEIQIENQFTCAEPTSLKLIGLQAKDSIALKVQYDFENIWYSGY